MKLEFVPKFITLLAGAVVCVITIAKDMDVTYSLELLLATLVIFYIIGLIAKKIIQKVIDGNMFVRREETVGDDTLSAPPGADKEKKQADAESDKKEAEKQK